MLGPMSLAARAVHCTFREYLGEKFAHYKRISAQLISSCAQ